MGQIAKEVKEGLKNTNSEITIKELEMTEVMKQCLSFIEIYQEQFMD